LFSGKATLCNRCGVKWRNNRETAKPIPKTTITEYEQHQLYLANSLTSKTLNQDQLYEIVNILRSHDDRLNDETVIDLDLNLLNKDLVEKLYVYVKSVESNTQDLIVSVEKEDCNNVLIDTNEKVSSCSF
jgi:hypothetical protein